MNRHADFSPQGPGTDQRAWSLRGRPTILLALFGLGVSAAMTQLTLMREMLSVFAGNEMVLGIILGLWLLLTGVGTWLGYWPARLGNLRRALFVCQLLVALLPPAQVWLLRSLRHVIFLRGAAVGVTETVLSSFVLLAPYGLVSGAMLTLACAILSRDDGAAGAGRVYVADSLGSVAGGALFSFVLVPRFDHLALLAWPAVLNLALAALLSFGSRRRGEASATSRIPHSAFHIAESLGGAALAAGLALSVLILWWAADLDAISTARQYPGQNVILRTNSPYGRLIVTEAAGQITFFENGLPVIATHHTEQVEETVHYAMAQRPNAARVLLLGGGISGTAPEILQYGVRAVTYVEIDPAILAAGRRFLPGHLADPRIQAVTTDGRRFVRRTPERFDVVIVDVPEPATSQLNRFYTEEFFGEVKRVLATNGVLSFALGHYANYVSPELARMLASTHRTLRRDYTNVLMIPGGRVCFLASDGPLTPHIADSLERHGITPRLVNRHYLSAMLSPDRLADLQRAVAQPAEVNQDFNPVLYYYHLRHWMSQFTVRWGAMEGALALLGVVYLARLRPVPLALFASGFAASGLEVVLLLAFQILCGSLYQQVGLIVTTFMAGLALGAWFMNRHLARRPASGGTVRSTPASSHEPAIQAGRDAFHCVPEFSGEDGDAVERVPTGFMAGEHVREVEAASREPEPAGGVPPAARCPSATSFPSRCHLALLAVAVAVFAGLLPVALTGLARWDASLPAIHVFVALLTLLLAALVGLQFPLANQIAFRDGAATASRLFTADFVGASLGALLASTLLIPLLGVTTLCLLTAVLNLAAAAAVQWGKAEA